MNLTALANSPTAILEQITGCTEEFLDPYQF
jgi:hypothetical protein